MSNKVINSHSDYERDSFLAVQDIADILRRGSLMLFLGSGASSGFGLPNWALLVARLLGKDDDRKFMNDLAKKSDKELTRILDGVDDGTEAYMEKLHEALYTGISDDLSLRFSQSPLLLAVAALITGSCRGRIASVITYNYDDLLVQYLRMLGYRICIRTNPSDPATWADVEINHVHGYLPQSKKNASNPDEFVLSEKSYRRRQALIDEGWSPYIEYSLYSRTGLFLGLSGDDGAMLSVFERVRLKIKRPRDYTGYWLMTPDAYQRNAQAIIDVGMCPISLKKTEFSKFVFAVCQRAGGDGF